MECLSKSLKHLLAKLSQCPAASLHEPASQALSQLVSRQSPASHAMHVWADANLYQPIVQQDNMFPLSYPATAKTLMARYSLLDIENYQQRKALQFNKTMKGIIYPAEPVYCSVDSTKKFL